MNDLVLNLIIHIFFTGDNKISEAEFVTVWYSLST